MDGIDGTEDEIATRLRAAERLLETIAQTIEAGGAAELPARVVNDVLDYAEAAGWLSDDARLPAWLEAAAAEIAAMEAEIEAEVADHQRLREIVREIYEDVTGCGGQLGEGVQARVLDYAGEAGWLAAADAAAIEARIEAGLT